ncbi:MAG: hypothetical protein EHV01_002925 [Spiroplasma sp. hy2]|uniref:hypothetical protein n=1 Tax=Spiroplasma sp. hy2 TaxID=2490850 RepID=UPI0038407DFF
MLLTEITKFQAIWDKIISVGMPSTIGIIVIIIVILIIKYIKIKRIIYTFIFLGIIVLICLAIWYFKDDIIGILPNQIK